MVRGVMQQLRGVATEYEAQVGQQVVVDVNDETNNPSIEQFLEQVRQVEACERMLDGVPDQMIPDNQGARFLMIEDPWENTIIYRNYQRNGDTGEKRSDDVIDVFKNEEVPVPEKPFFASRGPDGVWGTDDDIYSFEVD